MTPDCDMCGGTGKLTPADLAACSDPECCYQGELDCPCVGYEGDQK